MIKKFIKDCTVVDINKVIKNHTISFRKKYDLKLPDAIVTATTKYLNLPLMTADKDFLKVKNIDVIFYETSTA